VIRRRCTRHGRTEAHSTLGAQALQPQQRHGSLAARIYGTDTLHVLYVIDH
jgi:hypothetical protein